MRNLFIVGILGSFVFIILTVKFPDLIISPGELSQGHQDIKNQCFLCHQAFGGIQNRKCIACHNLEEIGRDSTVKAMERSVIKEKVLFHKNLGNYSCIACHTDHAGRDPELTLKSFNHEMLPENIINNCLTCHSKPSDKMHGLFSEDCYKCHSTKEWNLETAFTHDLIKPDFRNYCIDCHQRPSDVFHKSLKDNCLQCHSFERWLPSTFEHSTYFVLDSDHNVKCSTCHINSDYKTYTCYGCHEHTVSNILQEHNEEGIKNINNCVSCHKSSDENESEDRGKVRNKDLDDD